MTEGSTLFDRFGGTRQMADHLGEPPSTVQSWKAAGRIPATKQPAVLDKGKELGLPVTAEDVIFPLRPAANAVCGLCERCSADATIRSCVAADCPMRTREAA